MTHEPQKLTSGNLPKQILLFSIPLIFSSVLQVLFNISDIAVVGRFAGAEALGAVGSTTHLAGIFTCFLIGMTSGVNVLVARYYGAENRESLRQAVHTGFLVCLAAGFALLVLGQIIIRPLLTLLGTKPDLMDGAVLYLRIYFLGLPGMAIYNYGNAVFSAVGDTKRPLGYLLFSGILNVALNIFFVLALRMDVDGVALASILSQYLAAALILTALFRARTDYGLRPGELRIHRARAKNLLALGITAGLQNAIFCIANLFIQSCVNSFDSVIVEGNAAAANVDTLIYNVMNAFYIACASFISQNLGAHKRERIRQSYLICLAYTVGISMLLSGLSLIFSRQILSLFTTEEAVIEAGLQRLVIMNLSYWISAFMDGTTAASRGLGRTILPTVFIILGSCVFRVIWVYTVFAWFGTIESLYLVYTFSWTLTAIAEIWYFIRSYKELTSEFQTI